LPADVPKSSIAGRIPAAPCLCRPFRSRFMLPIRGSQTAQSFQDRRISESLNSRQAICLRRREADLNNAEMHGPKSASRSSLVSPTLLAVYQPAFIDLGSCICNAISMRSQATTRSRFDDNYVTISLSIANKLFLA